MCLSDSILKVYVVTKASNRDMVGGRSLKKHDLIIRFLRGRILQDLTSSPLGIFILVLQALQKDPFEP